MSEEEAIDELKQKLASHKQQFENFRASNDENKTKKAMSAEVVDSNPYRFVLYLKLLKCDLAFLFLLKKSFDGVITNGNCR